MGLETLDAQAWEKVWGGIGLLGQGAFTARFLVQWLASERKRETVLPVAFWWFSLAGGLITLTYVIHLGSLSLTLGQGMGLIVYVRNLMLVGKAKRREAKRRERAEAQRTRRIDAPEESAARV
ncbi:MAG: lipid-A-disaccharide synthase N-terminal domain-containing protein [Isosphaeraceae bacterium]|nr:lipid-A-disaccharide synthase N-terminal domain-containing protein [Isosphaeraceae bacterium]